MKIIVLHGEDTEKSYERLKRFIDTAKERSWEVIYLDENASSLQDALSSQSLFGGQRFFILRDIKKFGKKESEWLNKKSSDLLGTLIVYHPGSLNVTFLKSLPKDTKIEEFKLSKSIWKFLDNMNVKSFHEVLKNEPVEFIFAMIVWKLRKKYQAAPSPELAEIIKKLAEIDVDAKTGKADLASSLDLLLIKYLE